MRHRDRVRAVAFSPDGRTVLTACGDLDGTSGEARVWDVETSKPISPTYPGKVRNSGAVAFSPDGRLVLTGAVTGDARLWRAPTEPDATADQLAIWAEVITGMELDTSNEAHRLDPSAWQQRRRRLAESGKLVWPE